MQKIEKIQNKVDEVIKKCITNYINDELRNKFNESTDYILHYSNDFDMRILSNNVHTLMEHDNVLNVLSKREMISLYEDKFAKIKQPGRVYYDQIILLARNGKCPFCGIRSVSTLDHFLPKSKYPTLAVTPSNLVPACYECNFIKRSKSITSQYNVPLHPYFDNLENQIWLKASIDQKFIIRYFIDETLNWDEVLFNRTLNHFKSLKLSNLYSLNALDEISNFKLKWKNTKETKGIDLVITDIEETLISFESVDVNSWKSALYRALKENPNIISNFLDSE